MNINDINNFLNKKSGVLGISGVSSDFRDVQDAAEKGDDRAQLHWIFSAMVLGNILENILQC